MCFSSVELDGSVKFTIKVYIFYLFSTIVAKMKGENFDIVCVCVVRALRLHFLNFCVKSLCGSVKNISHLLTYLYRHSDNVSYQIQKKCQTQRNNYLSERVCVCECVYVLSLIHI